MSTSSRIYWDYENQFERQKKIMAKWKGSKENKALIARFQDHQFGVGAKQARVAKLTWGLRKICDLAGKPLSILDKEDLERIVAAINREKKPAEATKSDYKRCIKQFFAWFEDEDPRLQSAKIEDQRLAQKFYVYLRKKVKTSCPYKTIDPGNIITDEDIKIVIQKGCNLDYERAFLVLLHETGMRVGEILGIRLMDIQDKTTHWLIRIDGKTGERTVPVMTSIPYLAQWINHHPDRENRTAYLWVSDVGKWRGKPIRYNGAVRLIQRCFKRSGVEKKHNPHHFRHSRATLDAPHYSEVILCKLRGWTIGSQQVRRYTHLSGKEAEDAFLRHRGIKSAEEVEEPKNVVCACGEQNTPESKYCHRCGKALNIEAVEQEQRYLSDAFQAMQEMMKNPEMRQRYEQYLKQFEQ